MTKLIYSYLIALLISGITLYSWGQNDPPQIKFDAKITSVEKQGSKLNVVKVFISEGGTLFDSTVTQHGRMFYQLDTGKIYKIEFTKSGYVSKHLVISTIDAPEKIKKNSKLKVEVSLFKAEEGLNVDFLKTKPIGVARYDYMKGKLQWDRDYTRSIIEQIITATLENYNQKHPEE